ncbi:MAG: helix-hairpin-helix domain-containing protein [bacterium]
MDRKKIIKTIAPALALGCICLCILIYEKWKQPLTDKWIQHELKKSPLTENVLTKKKLTHTIHIAGAVNKPGVYHINHGKRVMDIIEQAGGLKTNANLDKVNLAAKIKDGKRIFIPFKKHRPLLAKNTSMTYKMSPININNATQKIFCTINGIGPKTAQSIIRYRQKHGLFKNVDELQKVKGISLKKIRKWQQQAQLIH